MTEHNHGGDPTYAAYAMGCRNADCLRAFQEYKLRLAARKLSGQYRDLRLKENRLAEQAAAFCGDHAADSEPVVGEHGPEPTSATSAPPADSDSSGDEPCHPSDSEVVLKYLRMCVADFTTGRLNEAMVNVMPIVTRLPNERCQAAAAKLIEDGALISDGTNLFIAQESR